MSEAIQKQLLFDGTGEEKKWDIGFCGKMNDLPLDALLDLESVSPRIKRQYMMAMIYAKTVVRSGILGDPGENYQLLIDASMDQIFVKIALYPEEVPTTLEEAAEKLL